MNEAEEARTIFVVKLKQGIQQSKEGDKSVREYLKIPYFFIKES